MSESYIFYRLQGTIFIPLALLVDIVCSTPYWGQVSTSSTVLLGAGSQLGSSLELAFRELHHDEQWHPLPGEWDCGQGLNEERVKAFSISFICDSERLN